MANARQTGSLKRTGKNTFQVRVFQGYDNSGTRRYVSQKVSGTLKDAREVLAAMLTQRDKGEPIRAPRRQAAPQTLNAYSGFRLLSFSYKSGRTEPSRKRYLPCNALV